MPKKSYVRLYFLVSIGFGIFIGLIFPFFTDFFAVYRNEGCRIAFVIGCITAGIIVGGFSFLIGNITIIKIIRKISGQLLVISRFDGDLTKQIKIESHDEIGRLVDHFNLVLASLRTLIVRIGQAFGKTRDLGMSLNSSSRTTSALLTDIERYIGNMNDNTETLNAEINKSNETSGSLDTFLRDVRTQVSAQSQEINKSYSSIEEMIFFIQNIAMITETKIRIIDSLQDIAASGQSEMKKTISVIGKITASTKAINELLTVIDTISGKLNLLAMNAAIEAAHAGEKGRGFAIVAHEIRSLAETTSRNTKEISRSLTSMVEDIRVSEESSGTMGEYFTNILVEIGRVNECMKEIERALKEISSLGDKTMVSLKSLLHVSETVNTSTNTMAERVVNIFDSFKSICPLSDDTRRDMARIIVSLGEIDKNVAIVSGAEAQYLEHIADIETLVGKFKTV